MKFKIAWLYYDLLDLYSDVGNIKVIKSILKFNNIDYQIQKITIADEVDLSTYDFIFLGGGSDMNQSILSEDLLSRKKNIENALKKKTFILAICGGYQMFGKYYEDHMQNKIKCLGIFDYYTKSQKQRSVGNIQVKLNKKLGTTLDLIGFENHGGQTFGIKPKDALGKVIKGYGNNKDDKLEGFISDSFIGTYCHGPLFPKNPEIARYIIEKVLSDKHNKKIKIKIEFLSEAKKAQEQVIF